jgi:hypothetical protein
MSTDNRLLSPTDLVELTGLKRYTKQVEWFKRKFGIDAVCRGDGSIVMTWATYEALSAKKAGVGAISAKPAVELCYD